MSQQDHENVCRVCLSSDKMLNNKGVSLFEEYKDSSISDHINSLTNVEIKRNDGLPSKICPDCLLELETSLNFKQKCENSNSILHGKNQSENFIKLEINSDDIKKEDTDDLLCPTIEEEYLEDDYVEDKFVEDYDATKVNIDRPSRAIDLKLICDDCGGTFTSKCKIRVHWKKVHMHEKLICQTCKRAFKSYKAYNRHHKGNQRSCIKMKNVNIQGTGKNRLYLCRDCPYTSKRNKDIQVHLLRHSGEKPAKCSLCQKQYTQLGSLQAHMERAHGAIKVEITCQYCGKIVRGRNTVYKHLKSHQAITVQCDLCKKVFKNKIILQTHMVRHTGIKSFTCEKCAKTFFTFSELCTHKRMKHTHPNSWYKCQFCEYKSRRSTSTKVHQAKHTGTNVCCNICGTFFDTPEKLAQHIPRHLDSEKKHQCPHCDKRFYKKDSIRKHVKAKHKVLFNQTVPIKNEQDENIDISPTKVNFPRKIS